MANLLAKSHCYLYKICGNQFHTSAVNSGIFKTMKKVMGGSKSKKKYHFAEAPVLQSPDAFTKSVTEGSRSKDSKRASMLNKLFMRHITDLMATGPNASEFLGYGIEVNMVKISPDYSTIRVYWVAKSAAAEENVDEILQRNSGPLRHELSQLKLMGVVPRIQFVKDKQYAEIMEIDARLSKADFGEDHEPIALSEKLKNQLELHASIDDETKEKIQNLEENLEEDEIPEEPLPVMPQNVLGLDHSDILKRIKKSIKKSEALHRINCEPSTNEERPMETVNLSPVIYPDDKSEREAFKKFLQKRQIMQMKAKRGDKNFSPDVEYIREELSTRYKQQLDSMDLLENDDNDYLEEEDNPDCKK